MTPHRPDPLTEVERRVTKLEGLRRLDTQQAQYELRALHGAVDAAKEQMGELKRQAASDRDAAQALFVTRGEFTPVRVLVLTIVTAIITAAAAAIASR